jgi:hypothetical protein
MLLQYGLNGKVVEVAPRVALLHRMLAEAGADGITVEEAKSKLAAIYPDGDPNARLRSTLAILRRALHLSGWAVQRRGRGVAGRLVLRRERTRLSEFTG